MKISAILQPRLNFPPTARRTASLHISTVSLWEQRITPVARIPRMDANCARSSSSYVVVAVIAEVSSRLTRPLCSNISKMLWATFSKACGLNVLIERLGFVWSKASTRESSELAVAENVHRCVAKANRTTLLKSKQLQEPQESQQYRWFVFPRFSRRHRRPKSTTLHRK